jgi:hypothetical protein
MTAPNKKSGEAMLRHLKEALRLGMAFRFFHVLGGLLVGFLDFGFGVCLASEIGDRFAKANGSGSRDFCFERREAAGDA